MKEKVTFYIKVRNISDQKKKKIRKQKKVLLKFVCKKLFQFFEKQLYIYDYISNHDKTGVLTISMIRKEVFRNFTDHHLSIDRVGEKPWPGSGSDQKNVIIMSRKERPRKLQFV